MMQNASTIKVYSRILQTLNSHIAKEDVACPPNKRLECMQGPPQVKEMHLQKKIMGFLIFGKQPPV